MKTCVDLDDLRLSDEFDTPESFEEVKRKLSESEDLRAILKVLSEEKSISDAMGLMLTDVCLAEICRCSVPGSPLVEFPYSINENVFCKVVEFALAKCPVLLNLTLNLVVRRGDPVLPRHVFRIVTLFSTICYVANHNLDPIIKLRSITLQADGLSIMGLNILSDQGLTQCSRYLSNLRDLFNLIKIIGRNIQCYKRQFLNSCKRQSADNTPCHITVGLIVSFIKV